MRNFLSALFLVVFLIQSFAAPAVAQAQQNKYTKTALLSDKEVTVLGAEISGVIAKDTVVELARSHRVQATSGYARAAEFIA